MTQITRMVFNGFKSFAKRTELVFGDNFNVILGPNGSGKCLTGDAIVHLADGSLVQIGDLVSEAMENEKQEIEDGFIAKGDGKKVLCLAMDSLKVESKEITHYVKRTAPEKLLRITTRSGKAVTATPYHPLFILSEGKVKAARADELKEGTRIAIPRFTPIISGTKIFLELLDLIKPEDKMYVPFNPEFGYILKQIKGKDSWQSLSKKLGIPERTIDGLFSGQSINFSYLVKILRYRGLDDIAITKKITHLKSKNGNISCRMPWENSPEFSRILGYLLSEGRITKSNQIWFTNGTEEVVQDYSVIIEKVFGIKPTINEYKPNCWDVLAYSRAAIVILSKFGMSFEGTKGKSIANIFLKYSSEEELCEILNGLYCGDGYISGSSIEITTKSSKLALAIESIITRLGMTYSSRWVIKAIKSSGFSGIYKTIIIYGADNAKIFRNKIKLIHDAKRERVEKLASKTGNPNLDLVEVNGLVKEAAKELGLSPKKLKKEHPKLDAYVYNTCTPSAKGIQQLVSGLLSKHDNGSEALKKLTKLANSHIYWDEISSIEEIKQKEKWVYDLCVEKDHNFIANNMFVHNSNVIDGLCFVLGRLSSKSMRAERLSYLIYNGGKTKKPANKAEVSIFFDNSKATFPIQDSVVKITRMVNQKGQSIYRINDERRTRTQIIDLMAAAKINPDGYNIILQGDITKFVEMFPEERREMIEDIAGIGVYEEKKKKALSELEKVEGRIKEAEILLAERKAYLKELKQDRDQALKYKEVHDKIKQSKATLLDFQIRKKKEQRAELEESLGDVKGQIKRMQDEIDAAKKEITNKKEEIKGITEEIDLKGEKEQIEMHKGIEDLKVEIATKKNRISSCETELKKIWQRKEQLSKDSEELDAKINELKTELQELESQKREKLKEETSLLRNLEKLRQQNKIEELADIEIRIESTDKDIEKNQAELQSLVEQKQNFLREKDRTEIQLQNFEDSIRKAKELETENKTELEAQKSRRNEFKNSVLELNRLLNEDSELAARLAASKKNLIKTEEQITRLNARKIGIREISSNNAIQAILSQKNKIDGIYDKVSELGSVKSQYAQALEAAAGPRLNSIVVQNDETAAECIKYLKKNKLGTATFLPLNKIKGETEKMEKPEINGVHELAVNLISYEPKFKKIFSYVFGSTMVVENIDVARRAGIGKYRMVTLDGDLTEMSGAMHGGYKAKKAESGFLQQEIAKELNEYETQAEELRNSIAGIEKRRKECEEKISQLKNKKAELEAEMIKSEKIMNMGMGLADNAGKQKEALHKGLEKISAELSELQSKITDKSKELAATKNSRQELRDKIGKLRSPAFLAELNAFEQKIKEVRGEILKTEGEIKTSNTKINELFMKEKEKIGKILQQLDNEGNLFRKEVGELKKIITEKSSMLKGAEEKAAKFYSQYKALFAKKDRTTEELQKTEERAIRKEEQIRTHEMKVNNSSLKMVEISGELAGLHEEFRQYEDVQLLQNAAEEQLKSEVSKFERSLSSMGNVNLKALEIYEDVEKQYNSMLQKKESLAAEKNDVLTMINEVELRKKDLFMETFSKINQNFQQVFESISTKGAAYLMVENEQNPFEAGVRIKVRITGEKYLDIRSLSGGEKTLTALSLIFAIQEYEPASFYVLDEVDAALDRKNSEKLAELIKKYSGKAQYVVISHNDTLVSEADILYGISMDEHGMSNLVGIKA